MAAFLPDAWIVDAIIALVAIEGVCSGAMARANRRRPARSGNSRKLVVGRGPPAGPAHGAHRAPRLRPSWPCYRLRSSLTSPTSRADGKPGRRADPTRLVRCIIAGFARYGLEDRLKAMKVLGARFVDALADCLAERIFRFRRHRFWSADKVGENASPSRWRSNPIHRSDVRSCLQFIKSSIGLYKAEKFAFTPASINRFLSRSSADIKLACLWEVRHGRRGRILPGRLRGPLSRRPPTRR